MLSFKKYTGTPAIIWIWVTKSERLKRKWMCFLFLFLNNIYSLAVSVESIMCRKSQSEYWKMNVVHIILGRTTTHTTNKYVTLFWPHAGLMLDFSRISPSSYWHNKNWNDVCDILKQVESSELDQNFISCISCICSLCSYKKNILQII